jgi:hypothetical protein
MTKESLIWLAVRFTGLVFAYLAVMALVTFVSSALTLYQTSAMASIQTSTLSGYEISALSAAKERVATVAWFVLGGQLLYVIVHGGLAGYLLRDGWHVFELLNLEGDVGRARASGIETTLHLGDS